VVKIEPHLDFFAHLIEIIPYEHALVKREIDISHPDIEIIKSELKFSVREHIHLASTHDISPDG
jgi:hypothetical protein